MEIQQDLVTGCGVVVLDVAAAAAAKGSDLVQVGRVGHPLATERERKSATFNAPVKVET